MRKKNPRASPWDPQDSGQVWFGMFPSLSVKEKVILALVKRIRKILFKTIVIGALQQGRKIRLISEYSKDGQ